jgi:hypothetical protein
MAEAGFKKKTQVDNDEASQSIEAGNPVVRSFPLPAWSVKRMTLVRIRKQKSSAPAGMLQASQAQSCHGLFEHGVVACNGIRRRNRGRVIRCQSNFFKQGFLYGVLYPARYRELPPVGEFERTRVSRPLAEELCYTIFSPVRDVKPPIPGGHSC